MSGLSTTLVTQQSGYEGQIGASMAHYIVQLDQLAALHAQTGFQTQQ